MSNKCYCVIIDHKLFMTARARKRINIKVKDNRKSLTAAFKAVTKNNKNISVFLSFYVNVVVWFFSLAIGASREAHVVVVGFSPYVFTVICGAGISLRLNMKILIIM